MNTFDKGGRFQRLVAKGRPLVIAHRGSSGAHPENTVAAYQQAISDGADIIELDLRMTRDGHVVALHDATVERTTNGHGYVEDLDLSTVKALDAGFRFSTDGGETFPFRGRGLTIPTLEEVLTALPEHLLMLELKVSSSRMVRQVIAILRRMNRIEQVSIELFAIKTKHAKLLRHLEPRLTTGHTRAELVRFVSLAKLGLGKTFQRRAFCIEMPPRRNRLAVTTKRTLKAASKKNIPMFVWTINHEEDMRHYLNSGAAGLFTDYPQTLRRLVDSGNWDGR